MSSYVSIDGGKSGLRVLVQGPNGRQLGTGPGFTYGQDDVTAIVAAVSEAAHAIDLPDRVAGVCAGLTGVPSDVSMRRRVRAGIEEVFGGPAWLVEDAVIAHAGALGASGAVACVGTGVTALAVSESGRSSRVDGWGPIIGDRGGAYFLGQRGLQAAAAAIDGTGPTTRLSAVLVEGLGGADLHCVQEFYRDTSLVARIAAFGSDVVVEADRGDPIAREICTAAAEEIARSVDAAGDRAGLVDEARVASYSGRLLDAGTTLLQVFRDRLESSGWRVIPPLKGPLDGGIDLLRSPHAAYRTLLDDWKDREQC